MKKLLIILFFFFLCSCKTLQVVEKDTTTQNISAFQKSSEKDSIYIYKRDSIFMKIKGDTVLIEKFNTLYDYRYIIKTDTIIKDSISYKDKEIITTIGPSKWQIFWEKTGQILAIIFILFIIIFIKKPKR